MNTIQKVIEESNKEFDEKFVFNIGNRGITGRDKKIKSFISQRDHKILSAIEEEIGKDKELWEPVAFPAGKEGVLDNETVLIAMENMRNMRNNDYERGYNTALAKFRKLLSSTKENIK